MVARIFLSWCHRDSALKDDLVGRLMPLFKVSTDVKYEWWEDSHLTCGEELNPGIIDRIDEADYGLLLVSPAYLASDFIRAHELPRFVGPHADKAALPVALTALPDFKSATDFGGLDKLAVFLHEGKNYQSSRRKPEFAVALAKSIRGRVLDLNRFRAL